MQTCKDSGQQTLVELRWGVFDLPQLYKKKKLVGKLIYLTITRLDISVVSIVSQFMHSPTTADMMIVKRILLMQNHGHTQILDSTDVGWVGNTFDKNLLPVLYICWRKSGFVEK